MLASFALFFVASVVPSVLRYNARLSLPCYRCVTTDSLWHSVALRKVQADLHCASDSDK